MLINTERFGMRYILPLCLLLLLTSDAISQDHGDLGGLFNDRPLPKKMRKKKTHKWREKVIECDPGSIRAAFCSPWSFTRGSRLTLFLRGGVSKSGSFDEVDTTAGYIQLIKVTTKGHIITRFLLKDVIAIEENVLLGKRKFFHKNTRRVVYDSRDDSWDRYKIGKFGYFDGGTGLTVLIEGGSRLTGRKAGKLIGKLMNTIVSKYCRHGEKCGKMVFLRNKIEDDHGVIRNEFSYIFVDSIIGVEWFEEKE
jgi:hypothetical protein